MKKLLTVVLLIVGSYVYANSMELLELPCSKDQYYRIQTKECLPLKYPSWGFQGFKVPDSNVYSLRECTQTALQNLLDAVPKEGGKIVIPACTINTVNGIDIPDNVILQGGGIGKTVINNISTSTYASSAINLRGMNNIFRSFTVNGNGSTLNGINGYISKGNVLVEFIETKNFKPDQGSGISFLTAKYLDNSRITVRYTKTSGGLHGIDIKIRGLAKTLIYSNESFGNANYGIDMSTNDSIEVSGNYLHDNVVAGAKSPMSTNIFYHNNDINRNGAGIAYIGSNPSAVIRVENNNLSNNKSSAFATWAAVFDKLILKNNNVSGSKDQNGYSILGVGINSIEVTGNHGKIYTEGKSSVSYK